MIASRLRVSHFIVGLLALPVLGLAGCKHARTDSAEAAALDAPQEPIPDVRAYTGPLEVKQWWAFAVPPTPAPGAPAAAPTPPALTTIEQMLFSLPTSYRSHYALMFEAKDLQGPEPQAASYEHPRVIMYPPGATFLIAFNGHPKQRGYDSLEIIQWSAPTRAFEFYRINELTTLGADGKPKISLKLSEKNPDECMTCHRGPDPRPNWETYNRWPGAYGGSSEQLGAKYYSFPLDDGRELAKFEAFKSTTAKEGRYRALVDLERQHVIRKDEVPGYFDYYTHPNVLFLKDLTPLNAKRIARLIRADPLYERLKLPLLAALRECEKIEDYAPKDLPPPTASFNEVMHSTYAAIAVGASRDAEFSNQSRPETIAKVRWVMERQGRTIDDWSMSFLNEYGFNDPIVPFGGILAQELALLDPFFERYRIGGESFIESWQIYLQPFHAGEQEKYCREQLKPKP